MLHPLIPAPDSIKPTLKAALVATKEKCSHENPERQYICLAILDVGCDADNAAAAFIQSCLGKSNNLEWWLASNDPKYEALGFRNWQERINYSNKARIAWLEWLTQPQTTEQAK